MKYESRKLIGMSLLVFSLVGCGGGGGSSAGNEQNSSVSGNSSSGGGSVSSSSQQSSAVSSASSEQVSSVSSSADGNGSVSSASSEEAQSSASSSGSGAVTLPNLFFNDKFKIDWSNKLPPDRVHFNDFVIVRSDKGVTVSDDIVLQSENLNGDMYGRYLEVGHDDSEFPDEYRSLIAFEKGAVLDALNARFPDLDTDEMLEKVTTVSMAVWVEGGDLNETALIGIPYFDENRVTWNSRPDESLLLATQPWNGGKGWYNIEIPLSYFKSFMTGEQQAAGRGYDYVQINVPGYEKVGVPVTDIPSTILNIPSYKSFELSMVSDTQRGQHLTLSSDETRRAPALVITYESDTLPEEGVYEALGTETDAQRDRIDISYTPQNPKIGDTVHINVTATDNEGVDYIAVMEGSEVVAYKAAPDNTTHSLTLSYDTVAESGLLMRTVVSDDKSGLAGKNTAFIYQRVRGNGREPTLQTGLQYEIPEVHPADYRFIKNDGQRVTLNIHAEDPDGLAHMEVSIGGKEYRYTFNGRRSVDKTIEWYNDDTVTVDTFSYRVSVTDRENKTAVETVPENSRIPIRDWDDLDLYRNTLVFQNLPLGSNIPFSPYMSYIFSHGEAYTWGSKDLLAYLVWKYGVKSSAKDGLCYGMSATAIALTNGSVLHSYQMKPGAQSNDLSFSDEWAKKYLMTAHGSQISDEVAAKAINYFKHHRHDRRWLLDRINDALDSSAKYGRYGVIAISNGNMLDRDTSAHAMVPWMVRKINENEWRIYVYDPNRERGPRMIQNNHVLPNFEEFSYFPYVSVDYSGNHWSYYFGAEDGYWRDGDVYFIPYGDVRGDSGQYNTLNSDFNLKINDHDLPVGHGVWGAVFGYMAVATSDEGVDLSITDSQGKVTGYVNGRLRTDSSEVIPMLVADADNRNNELFLLEKGKEYVIRVNGLQSSEYNLSLFDGTSVTSIGAKNIVNAKADTLVLTPDPDAFDRYKLTLTSAVRDEAFVIEKVHNYAELDGDTPVPAVKIFQMNDLSIGAGDSLDVRFNASAESLIVNSSDSNVTFNLQIRQTDMKTGELNLILNKPMRIEPDKPLDLTHL